MTDEPLDLSPLAPSDDVRDRVVAGALDRIGRQKPVPDTPPLWRLALEGAAPFAAPALAAAALLVFLAVGRPGPDPEADVTPAAALIAPPPGPWGDWLARSAPPTPQQLILTFAGGPR